MSTDPGVRAWIDWRESREPSCARRAAPAARSLRPPSGSHATAADVRPPLADPAAKIVNAHCPPARETSVRHQLARRLLAAPDRRRPPLSFVAARASPLAGDHE